MQTGQIFKIHSDFYYLEAEGKTFECKLREVLKKQKQKVFVGDFADFENGAIVKIHPRKNYITRPSVSNIDQVIIISSVKEPDLSFLQLNRYIAFAKYHKLHTVLCFNKNDLSDNDKTIEKVFSIYEPLGYDILFTSAVEGYGLEEFKKILQDKTSVLCGGSGVGKSSLISAVSGINLKTKAVSEKTGRGTHTTRHCEIIKLDTQTISATAIKGEYSFLTNESHSKIVKTAHSAYFKDDKVVYNDNKGKYQSSSLKDYLIRYGSYPFDNSIEGYLIKEGVTVTKEISDTDYKFKLMFDKEICTTNVKIEMRQFGGLDQDPSFIEDIEMLITVKQDLTPITLEFSSHYSAQKIISTDCHQKYTVTYSNFNETIEIPNLEEIISYFG